MTTNLPATTRFDVDFAAQAEKRATEAREPQWALERRRAAAARGAGWTRMVAPPAFLFVPPPLRVFNRLLRKASNFEEVW